MALSLALNWSPPPSSPLFDESTTPSGTLMNAEKQNQDSSSKSTLTSSGPMSTSSFSSSDPNLASVSRRSTSTQNGSLQAPLNRGYNSSQSYASVASNVQRGAVYQMPSYPGPALTSPQQSYSGASSQGPYASNVSAFSSYQAGLRDNNTAMGVSEDGRRRRTTSGPQKSTHSNYQDALQYYPSGMPQGMLPASLRSGSGLPPGAMAPSSAHPASPTSNAANAAAAAAAAANGYHPYRRTPKGSDAPAYYTSTTNTPVLPPMPGQPALAALAMPPQTQRIRATSTASIGAAKEANRSNTATAISPPLVSYSSAVTGATRPPQSTQQAGLGHLRNSPQVRPTIPSSVQQQQQQHSQSQSQPQPQPQLQQQQQQQHQQQRPEMSDRSDSGRSDRSGTNASATTEHRPLHTRADSNSSFHSATDGSQSTVSPTTSSGKSTTSTTLSSKKPSPLSKGAAAQDHDNEAVYGGSDDENTIRGRTTPTPSDKPKKGLSSKLRKALSFSTLNEIQQAEAAAAAPDRAYGGRSNIAYKRMEGNSSGETNGSSGSTRSTSPPRTPDNGAPPMIGASSAASISSRKSTRPPLSGSEGTAKRSLFNRKFNSSTDNISISSTVSSASVMLRKVGNLGKIARRSSLMGLTNMFNKDKDAGRDGMQSDNFGTIIPPGIVVPSDEAALGAKGKKDKVKAKKGSPALASVSHATVELESNSGAQDLSMTPAASYVRQHQLQMKQQAEADRIAKEKAEAERQAAIQRNTKTTDDVTESRQKMIEKEKERLKSKRGWRKKLGVGSIGSTSEAKQATGLETIPVDGNSISSGASYSSTPLASNMVQSASTSYQLDNSHDSAYDNDGGLEPPMMPGAMEQYEGSGDEYETDSLRHWGEGIERSRESASKIKQVKGILKNTLSFSEQPSDTNSPFVSASNSIDRPFATRLRANSYDAPQASTHPGGAVSVMSQISTTPAQTDRVDGVARPSTSEEERDRSRNSIDRTIPSMNNNTTSFGHHANSSMPTLSMMMNPTPTNQHSVTTPATRRHLVFAETQIYHSTWPAHIYDRRGELATCNRLTPLLAQRIKEELNTYKMEEMAVAPSSRIHTHFFV